MIWKRFFVLTLATMTAVPLSAFGQAALETLRNYPIERLDAETRQSVVAQLKWQLEKLDATRHRLEKRQEQVKEDCSRIDVETSVWREQISGPLQFVSPDVRSQLAGRCAEQLLELQLEAASLETKEELQEAAKIGVAEEMEEQNALRQELELQLSLAGKEYAKVKDNWERIQKMREGGHVTDHEAAEYDLVLAKSNASVQQLELKLKSVLAKTEKGSSRQLQENILMMSVKEKTIVARQNALGAFLDTLAKAAIHEREIRRLERKQELLLEKQSRLSERIGEIDMEIDELEALNELYDSRTKDGASTSDANNDTSAQDTE